MTLLHPDWRSIGGAPTAWFDAPSLTTGAAFADRMLRSYPDAEVDVRPSGVRVRVDRAELAEQIAALAAGLTANPSALQQASVVVEATDSVAVQRFWQGVLGYEPAGAALADPGRRDPALRIEGSDDDRPLRNRIHLDVVRPQPVVDAVRPGEAGGPYGVRHADPEGNEVDLVSGDPLGESAATEDWELVWSAIADYRVGAEQRPELVTAAAELADRAGFPLLIDVRPGRVVLHTGKDQADPDAHGLEVDFTELAAQLQAAARGLGAVGDPQSPRLVQVFLDAADVDAVRTFWTVALDYMPDRRGDVRDIVDPRQLGPVLVFQQIDRSETKRRAQRNRVRLELVVPSDAVQGRVSAALRAGGRLVAESAGRWRIADPEGNELDLIADGTDAPAD